MGYSSRHRLATQAGAPSSTRISFSLSSAAPGLYVFFDFMCGLWGLVFLLVSCFVIGPFEPSVDCFGLVPSSGGFPMALFFPIKQQSGFKIRFNTGCTFR